MDYQEQQNFTVKQLQVIAPLNVYCYLCLWTYSNADPRPEDLPIVVQSSTLEYNKKAISYFMPNHRRNWEEHSQTGNPMCSNLVNTILVLTAGATITGKTQDGAYQVWANALHFLRLSRLQVAFYLSDNGEISVHYDGTN